LIRGSDRILTGFAWLSGGIVVIVVLGMISFLIYRGAQTINGTLLFGDTYWMDALLGRKPVFNGIWPAVVGTFLLVTLSASLAIPIGVASGIYLQQYAPRRVRASLDFLVDLLSGTPSIVMGLFGFTLILALRKTLFPEARPSLLLAAGCIALLVLPYIIRTTQSAFEGIPEHFRLVGHTFGLTKWSNIRHTLLPLASRGILSGVTLAIGRAAEDTAIILLAGVAAHAGIPRTYSDKFEALPFRIYYLAAEHQDQGQLDQAFGTALLLLCLTSLLLFFSVSLQKNLEKRWNLQ